MNTQDITKLVEAFRAKALEEAAEKKRAVEERYLAYVRQQQAKNDTLRELLPLVKSAMSMADCVVHLADRAAIMVQYKVGESFRRFTVEFTIQVKDDGKIKIGPGKEGGFINSWLWRTEGEAHDVLLVLAEYNGRAVARGHFIHSEEMK